MARQAHQTTTSPVSTFTDREVAENSIGENLAANKPTIDEWLHSDDELPLASSFRHDGVIGRRAPEGATLDQIQNVSRSRVILVKDLKMPVGYRIQTAYPEP